jgi:hypothetical protein
MVNVHFMDLPESACPKQGGHRGIQIKRKWRRNDLGNLVRKVAGAFQHPARSAQITGHTGFSEDMFSVLKRGNGYLFMHVWPGSNAYGINSRIGHYFLPIRSNPIYSKGFSHREGTFLTPIGHPHAPDSGLGKQSRKVP